MTVSDFVFCLALVTHAKILLLFTDMYLVITGVMVAQYLQNVTRRLALGSELLYQYGQTVPGNEIAIYTMVGRYSGRSHSGFVRVVIWVHTGPGKSWNLMLANIYEVDVLTISDFPKY